MERVQTNAEGAALSPMPMIYAGMSVIGRPVFRKVDGVDVPITKKHTVDDVMPYGQVFEITHPDTGRPAAVWYEVVSDPGDGVFLKRRGGETKAGARSRLQLMWLSKNGKRIFDFPIEEDPGEQCVNSSVDRGEVRKNLYAEKGFRHATGEDALRIYEQQFINEAEAKAAKGTNDPMHAIKLLADMMTEKIGANPGAGYVTAKQHAEEIAKLEEKIRKQAAK